MAHNRPKSLPSLNPLLPTTPTIAVPSIPTISAPVQVKSPFRDAFLKRPKKFQQQALDASVTSDIPPRRL